MSKNHPENLEELCDYILEYQDDIYVREKVDGQWGAFALSGLPPKLAIAHVLRFIKEGRTPARLLRDNEPREESSD